MDPKLAERQSYYGAFETARADQSAADMTTQLRQELGKMPLDGTVDPKAVSEQFYKDHIGNGTGDRQYDDRLLAQFGRQAVSQVAAANEDITKTVKQNTTQAIISNAAQTLMNGGMTMGKLADMRGQIATVSNGDTKMADAILFASLGSVQNDVQAISVLKSMQDLGMDKEYPDQFNKLSGLMLERTNKVKTFDAGLAVDNYHWDWALERAKYPRGILPPEKVAEFASRWFAIDSIHGVGRNGSGLEEMLDRGAAKEVRQNAWDMAYSGKLGTQNLSRVASSLNETAAKVLGQDYDSAASRQMSARSPALKATLDGTGIVNPMASEAAAKDYATFVLTPGHRAASDDTISDTFKSTMGSPLNGKDPAAMARSFGFYNSLSQGGLSKDQLHRYFPDSTTENHFWGMQGMSQGGRSITQIAKDLTDYPYDQKVLDDASINGRVNLAKLSGINGKPEDIDRKIVAARDAAFLDSDARKHWYTLNASVGVDSNDGAAFDSLLADQFMIMKRGGKAVDIDQAIKNVAGQTGGYLMTPTVNGGLQAYRDPYGGRGRSLLAPLNIDDSSPLSISKGFRPIYALGAKVTNSMGEPEDTLVTWKEDAAKAAKRFPGMIDEEAGLYLERQDKNGLSMVKDHTGQMIQFMPGQKIVTPVTRTASRAAEAGTQVEIPGVLPVAYQTVKGRPAGTITTTADEAVEIPKDPKAAAEFFRKNLGPGWEVLPIGFDGPNGKGYVMHYAPRVKIGEAEKAQEIIDRGARVLLARKRYPTGPEYLPGIAYLP
jgi:hypothetical protein